MQILALVQSVLDVLNSALDKELQDCVRLQFTNPCFSTDAGIYAIYYLDELVYLGSATNFRARFREHTKSIVSATELDIADFSYRYVPCGKIAALAVEKFLIDRYHPTWNGDGFGSKQNGNGRRNGLQSAWDIKHGRAVVR